MKCCIICEADARMNILINGKLICYECAKDICEELKSISD